MKIIITADYEQLSQRAFDIFLQEYSNKPNIVLGLPTGSTPLGLYKKMIDGHKKGAIDFSEIISFNLDEYFGLPPGHPQSYNNFMRENLFSHVNAKKKNIHIYHGNIPNKEIEKYCKKYEEHIKQMGGIDLLFLGIGRDGHIAFNEPGSPLDSRTRLIKLAPETIEDNSRFFKNINDVPKYALTMGVSTIMDAKKIVLLASGKNKADAIVKTIEGPVSCEITASALQNHPDAVIIADNDAGGKLI